MVAFARITLCGLLISALLPCYLTAGSSSTSSSSHSSKKTSRSHSTDNKTPLQAIQARVADLNASQIAIAATATTIAILACAFGFKSLYQFIVLAKSQYLFRNENTNATGMFPVLTPERKICRKWENRYPASALRQIYEELIKLQTYKMPKDLYSMAINWNNGAFTQPDADGFCYPFLNFVTAIRAEENDLNLLFIETTSFFIWWRLQNYVASLFNSEGFLQNLNEYRARLKFLRQITIGSDEYKAEQAKFNERALIKLQLAALESQGQLTLPVQS